MKLVFHVTFPGVDGTLNLELSFDKKNKIFLTQAVNKNHADTALNL